MLIYRIYVIIILDYEINIYNIVYLHYSQDRLDFLLIIIEIVIVILQSPSNNNRGPFTMFIKTKQM